MKRHLIGLLFCVLSAAPHGRAAGSELEIGGVTYPFYAPGGSEPAVLVQIDRVHKDYQRRGFFRIGALPMLAAEAVTVRIAQPEHALTALGKLDARLRQTGQVKAVEWRAVSFIFGSEFTPRLHAGRMRLSRGATWELLDGVRVNSSTNEVRFSRAVLHVAGERAGQITAETGEEPPPIHFSFLPRPNNSPRTPP
jgi:hypothetical protein